MPKCIHMKFRVGLGQDSHRFLSESHTKPCVVGGLIFDDVPGLHSDSDGDVVFHALCNAITSLTGKPILGALADDLCEKDGITDSEVYLREGLKTIGYMQITHVAIALEAKRPHFKERINEMRQKVGEAMGITHESVGITATTGKGLTDVGCGDGIQCTAIVTAMEF